MVEPARLALDQSEALSAFRLHPASAIFQDERRLGSSDLEDLIRSAGRSGVKEDGLQVIPVDYPGGVLGALIQLFSAVRNQSEFILFDNPADKSGIPVLGTGSASASDCRRLTLPDSTFPSFQVMSSGSTAAPRRIRRTQRSWIRCFNVNGRLWEIGCADRVAIAGNPVHSLSLYAALEALHLGADLLLVTGLLPGTQLDNMCEQKATILYSTPSQLRTMAKAFWHGRKQPAQSLRKVFVGGSKLDSATRDAVERMFPGSDVHEFYGASETSFISITGQQSAPANSVGSAYPEVEIHIRRENGSEAGIGETGEIWVKSPYLFLEYAAGGYRRTRWHDGFLTVGEFGQLDETGNLYIAGRKDRMVTVADQNVFPEQIETILLGLPNIAQAAAIPIPDKKRGHILVAFLQGDSEAAPADEILVLCRSKMGPLKSPKEVVFLDEWPVLNSGKSDIAALNALATKLFQ